MGEENETAVKLRGQSIIQAMVDSAVEQVVALPDIVTCASTLWPILADKRLKLTQVCKEDEGVSICAALSYCDIRAVLFMQHTGFLDSINAIRAIATDYQLPVVMIVGLQGMEADRAPAKSASPGIRMLQPICEAMGLDHHLLDDESDIALIKTSIDKAYAQYSPVVLFISQSPEV
jgi:sulfopyruvate decarboxylase subunit alpha